ncbi:MAG: zinc-ribbon domain-containing protein [Nitrospirota bacterium]|nr:MAG: zinc-ribbon domain-containing protein [Nitrospirota bacterium]
MVVVCPKCKVKLNISDDKIAPEGSRFKCPKCATILLVKKPAAAPAAAPPQPAAPSPAPPAAPQRAKLDKNKVLVALNNDEAAQMMMTALTGDGFTVISSSDGVDAMVKASSELPFTAIVDVALPKVYGFEVCKRLKTAPETNGIKVILYTAVHDKNKYRRPPSSLYGADDYIEDHEIEVSLLPKVHKLVTTTPPAQAPSPPQPSAPSPPQPDIPASPRVEAPAPSAPSAPAAPSVGDDEWITKGKRLARTVLADVFLYNPEKAQNALRDGNFTSVFETEINEGRKMYKSRIPQEVRDKGDFFELEVESYLAEKKKSL